MFLWENIIRGLKKLSPQRINYLLKTTESLKRKPVIYIFKQYSICGTKIKHSCKLEIRQKRG